MTRRHSTDLPTLLGHWLLVLALVLSWSTGMRIAATDDRGDFAWLEPLLLQGAVEHWHFVSGLVLLMLACVYGVLLRARPSMGPLTAWRALRQAASSRRWALNRLLCWLGIALLLATGVSGALMFYAPGWLPEPMLARLHHWLAWSFPVFLVAHVAGQWLLGGLEQWLKILRPHRSHGRITLVGCGLAALAGLGAWGLDRALIDELRLPRVATPPILDGQLDDPVWRDAPPILIHTLRGANLVGGESRVRVRGVQDGQYAYLLFEWEDPTRDQRFMPLQKTADGWRLMQTGFLRQDENDHYEDKFAVMLSRSGRVGGDSIHLGPRPLKDRPGSMNGRGLHYTAEGQRVDVWHWKGTRTALLQQMDDNHFGPPLPAPDNAEQRYTGGYTTDPKLGGGFEENWFFVEGDRNHVRPRRVPKGPIPEGDPFVLNILDTVVYDPAQDTYPIGTILPSILLNTPMRGDRGDVAAAATWKDGWWRLEVRRRLDTASPYDLPIASGIFLWVGVFDHSQIRHTRHWRPLRLVVG